MAIYHFATDLYHERFVAFSDSAASLNLKRIEIRMSRLKDETTRLERWLKLSISTATSRQFDNPYQMLLLAQALIYNSYNDSEFNEREKTQANLSMKIRNLECNSSISGSYHVNINSCASINNIFKGYLEVGIPYLDTSIFLRMRQK